jgi:sugar phosphate isomerase/epimerase
LDLWGLKGVEQRFERWLSRQTAPVATLEVQNGWYSDNAKIMDEKVTLRLHPQQGDSQALDVKLVLTPVTNPITLWGAEGKSYGGLTLRFAPRTSTVITTPLGNGTNDLPMTRMPWADLTAQFQGAPGPSGAAVFVPRSHPDYPPMWLTRHYGVLCVGWPGVDARTMEPGKPVTLAYRVWIHRGAADERRLQQAYQEYIEESASAVPGFRNPFFAFDNGVGRGLYTPTHQAGLLRALGYDGISYNETTDLANRLSAIANEGLRVFALYVHGFMDRPERYERGLPAAIEKLRGCDTVIWLTVREARNQTDEDAAKLVREVADLASVAGLRVAIYPHAGFYVATAEHALAVMKLAGRTNVGVTLNLCHELMAGNGDRLSKIVELCADRLFMVSINGADPGKTTQATIKVLGEGTFDVKGLLKTLARANYSGPVGLQCYNVPGEPKDNLARSMKAWRAYTQSP